MIYCRKVAWELWTEIRMESRLRRTPAVIGSSYRTCPVWFECAFWANIGGTAEVIDLRPILGRRFFCLIQ